MQDKKSTYTMVKRIKNLSVLKNAMTITTDLHERDLLSAQHDNIFNLPEGAAQTIQMKIALKIARRLIKQNKANQ